MTILFSFFGSVNLEKKRFVAGSVVTFIFSLYCRVTEINIQFYIHFIFKDPDAHYTELTALLKVFPQLSRLRI